MLEKIKIVIAKEGVLLSGEKDPGRLKAQEKIYGVKNLVMQGLKGIAD